jgi:hypothetical protein
MEEALQALPKPPPLLFPAGHSFVLPVHTVHCISVCRCIVTDSFGDPGETHAFAEVASILVLKWLNYASPGDLRAIREIGVQLEDDCPGELMLIIDLFKVVMTSHAFRCLGLSNLTGSAFDDVLQILSKCAELGSVPAMLTLARMYFECEGRRRSLATYGVNPAAALEYLLEAANGHHDCEANSLLGKLYMGSSEDSIFEITRRTRMLVMIKHGLKMDLPDGADFPHPLSVEKSIDHFKKAIESYDALAEPKKTVINVNKGIAKEILGAFSRERVLELICVTGCKYMYDPERIEGRDPGVSNDPKRSMAILKWAASKGFSPAVTVLGGAHPKCAHCGNNNPSKHCPSCMCTRYCSRECQRKHWGHHKGECLTVFGEALKSFQDSILCDGIDVALVPMPGLFTSIGSR